MWDMLGRRIAARQSPPICLPELRKALLDEWCNIPQDQIDNLILSMPRRSITTSVNRTKEEGTKEVLCPEAVAVHNDVMGGVDRFD
ncbi:polypeptide N-acetylgalactosaminyltransferase 13 [Trichonephila clavipes]|nr:polypeptide N-acetylgalactosaminyltransferase 13 [Trichonephila clavipes]